MKLNNLKPAWRQFQLVHSLHRMDEHEILFILEQAEGMAVSKTNRVLMYTILFIVLTFCSQGG